MRAEKSLVLCEGQTSRGCSHALFFVSPFFFPPPLAATLTTKVLINILEHIPDMRVLLLGRVLGGISTSLLFSAFESWMVSEHRKQGENDGERTDEI